MKLFYLFILSMFIQKYIGNLRLNHSKLLRRIITRHNLSILSIYLYVFVKKVQNPIFLSCIMAFNHNEWLILSLNPTTVEEFCEPCPLILFSNKMCESENFLKFVIISKLYSESTASSTILSGD